jgi:transcriptional regulator GlxA family with amidase domain
MNTKLDQIRNSKESGQKTKWSVTAMAKTCDVSVRTLERYFLKHMGKSPKAWLAAQRQQQAIKLLGDGLSIKETATLLGYKQASSFTRKYKSHWGTCPSLKMPTAAAIESNIVAK